jgi:hypothetical protein
VPDCPRAARAISMTPTASQPVRARNHAPWSCSDIDRMGRKSAPMAEASGRSRTGRDDYVFPERPAPRRFVFSATSISWSPSTRSTAAKVASAMKSPRWSTPAFEIAVNTPRRTGGTGLDGGPLTDGPPFSFNGARPHPYRQAGRGDDIRRDP